MSRIRHDQFAKELLAGLLETVGKPQTEVNVTSEVRRIDLLFVPLPEKGEFRQRLGRIAATACLIEPYKICQLLLSQECQFLRQMTRYQILPKSSTHL